LVNFGLSAEMTGGKTQEAKAPEKNRHRGAFFFQVAPFQHDFGSKENLPLA